MKLKLHSAFYPLKKSQVNLHTKAGKVLCGYCVFWPTCGLTSVHQLAGEFTCKTAARKTTHKKAPKTQVKLHANLISFCLLINVRQVKRIWDRNTFGDEGKFACFIMKIYLSFQCNGDIFNRRNVQTTSGNACRFKKIPAWNLHAELPVV